MPPLAPVDSSSRKRKAPGVAAPPPDLGQLDLSGAEEDGLEDDSPGDGEGGSDDDHEPFPELYSGSSEESDDEPQDDQDLLRELEEEAELERELLEEEESEEDEDEDKEDADSDEAVSKFLARNTVKPNEGSQDFLAPSSINALTAEQKSALVGFDTRDYKDRTRKVISDITGHNKYLHDHIEPGYGSESGDDEVRL